MVYRINIFFILLFLYINTTTYCVSIDHSTNTDFSYITVEAGNLAYTSYPYQNGFYGLQYGLIKQNNLCFSFSLGLGINKNNTGLMFRTIPIDFDIYKIMSLTKRLNAYYGVGLGITTIETSINQSNTNFHWLFGIRYRLSSIYIFTVEYKKYYLYFNSTNFDSNLLKFGVSINI